MNDDAFETVVAGARVSARSPGWRAAWKMRGRTLADGSGTSWTEGRRSASSAPGPVAGGVEGRVRVRSVAGLDDSGRSGRSARPREASTGYRSALAAILSAMVVPRSSPIRLHSSSSAIPTSATSEAMRARALRNRRNARPPSRQEPSGTPPPARRPPTPAAWLGSSDRETAAHSRSATNWRRTAVKSSSVGMVEPDFPAETCAWPTKTYGYRHAD